MNALSEKSNQVRDSRTQWEAEQAAAASSNAGGSYSRSTAAGRSYSNNGGGAASHQPALLAVLRAAHPRPASLIGLKLRPRTRAWVGLVLGVSEATPLAAGVTTARKCTVVKTVSGTDLISQPKAQTIQ